LNFLSRNTLVPTHRVDIPPRVALLKDGRGLQLRHGRAGDEAGIAQVIVSGFPIYLRAARGDADRAIRGLVGELQPESYVVASLADGGPPIGVACVRGRARSGLGLVRRIRRKLAFWGVYGVLFFSLEKVRRLLLESPSGPGPGGLYRYRSAVDPSCRLLGVGRHIADFIDDYARAAGYQLVWGRHRADNRPVLALHRKRGCVLVECRPTRLARLLHHPGMVISIRELSAPAAPAPGLGAPVG
jgi:GNAT superfamily N-acetyltransferase